MLMIYRETDGSNVLIAIINTERTVRPDERLHVDSFLNITANKRFQPNVANIQSTSWFFFFYCHDLLTSQVVPSCISNRISISRDFDIFFFFLDILLTGSIPWCFSTLAQNSKALEVRRYLRGILRQPGQTSAEKPVVPVHQMRRQGRPPETHHGRLFLRRVRRQSVLRVLAVGVQRMAGQTPGLGRQIARQVVEYLLGGGRDFHRVGSDVQRHFPLIGHGQQRFVFRRLRFHHHRSDGRHFHDGRLQRPEE